MHPSSQGHPFRHYAPLSRTPTNNSTPLPKHRNPSCHSCLVAALSTFSRLPQATTMAASAAGAAASAAAATAAAAAANAGKRTSSSPGSKALFRGIVCSTLAVATGDYICQQFEGKEEEDGVVLGLQQIQQQQQQQPRIGTITTTKKVWDKERTLRMAAATAVVMAPTSWMIVMRLEKFFPGNSTAAVLKKTLANGCLAPLMISLHFSTITALENHPDARAHLEKRVSHNLLPTLASGVVFWPLINILNFRFVRLENRPVIGAMAGVAWSIYMSRQVNGKVGKTADNTEMK